MKKNLLSTLIFSLLWMGISSAHALMIKTDPAIINPIKIGDTFKLNVSMSKALQISANSDLILYMNLMLLRLRILCSAIFWRVREEQFHLKLKMKKLREY